MRTKLIEKDCLSKNENVFYLASKKNYKKLPLEKEEMNYLAVQLKNQASLIELNRYTNKIFVHVSSLQKINDKEQEEFRKMAFSLHKKIQESKISEITIVDALLQKDALLSFLEGLFLSHYQFIKYSGKKIEKKHCLQSVKLNSRNVSNSEIQELEAVCEAVKQARNLVNEPFNYLTAEKLSEEIQRMGNESGFSVEVFGKSKIQSLNMGGILAVNKGSVDEPTFSVLEWKPKNAKNKKPIVFIGKGIVYDTGGLSLKPTKDSMDLMKSDMGGAASVAGALYAIAKTKLPVYVVGLIPATDNRPGGNAYVPGDIIKMHNGLHVEVLNTDAEGRLILADALSYAKKYQPKFVVDLATLTGAAEVAIGKYASVAMGNESAQTEMKQLIRSGNATYERIVEFPFWEEYGELIKSDIADLKNIGGRDGGAITAGKFLEHFADYPWVHIDIAGPAFLTATDNYRGKGATGVGVRLLYHFMKNYPKNQKE